MEPGIIFSCGNCSKTFAKRIDYNRHQKRYERPHKCSICDRSFGLKTDRDLHRETHSESRPKFMCTFQHCKFKGASRKSYLLKHMQTSHMDAKDPNAQKLIRLHYQKTPNAMISQAEEMYLHLLEAVNQGNESDVKKFLSTNASFLVTDRLRGSKAGNLAAQKGHLNIIKMIVEAGVNADVTNLDTWLHYALRNGHFTTAGFLVTSGARITKLNQYPSLKADLLKGNCDGATAGDFAAFRGDLGLMKIVVAAGIDVNINTSDPWLHQALRNQHFATAELLIKSAADVNARSSNNQTPFEAAVLRGCETSISLLHQSGADVDSGNEWKARLDTAFVRSYSGSYVKLQCTLGQVLRKDEFPSWGHPRELSSTWARSEGNLLVSRFHPIDDGFLLEYSSDECGYSDENTLPMVEILIGVGASVSIYKVPRSCEEPATTLLSDVTCDYKWIKQLLVEERTSPRSRYLWERVIFRDLWPDGSPRDRVIRLLREWGPIATAAS